MLDVITEKKLVLVKQLYQQAEMQSQLQHSVVNRILAVIGFDLTVETLLKVLVSWIHTFVTNTIVQWQSAALDPIIPDIGWVREKNQELLNEKGASLKK